MYKDINEYLERPGEVLSMFSEALRILDRNTAELMVDRMKDEMETLKAQNEELKSSSEEKDAGIHFRSGSLLPVNLNITHINISIYTLTASCIISIAVRISRIINLNVA